MKNKVTGEEVFGEEFKFLSTLGIYELEIIAVDIAIQMLYHLNLIDSNLIVHVDNVGAAHSIRKGGGLKSVAAASAANVQIIASKIGKLFKLLYISTKRNPADVVSRLGKLEDVQ